MGELARPNRQGDNPPVTPVQAHRVSPDPRVIEALERIAAGADRGQAPPPPPPPSASPTVIYIQTGAPAAPVPAPQPQQAAAAEVHYHTTNVYHSGGRASRRRSVSVLGVASVMLGMAACVLYWAKAYQSGAIPVAAIGLAFGVLGLVLSVLVRHTRAGVPLAGIVICLVAVGQPLYWTGWLQAQAQHHAPEFSDYLSPERGERLINPAPVPAPAPGGAGDGAASPSTPASPAAPAPAPIAPEVQDGEARPGGNTAASPVEAARRRLAKAEQDAEAALEQNATYRTAKVDVADAEAQVKALRQTATGGSPELTAASQLWMEAQNRLQKLRASLLADDPRVQAARRDLAEAESRLPAAETPR